MNLKITFVSIFLVYVIGNGFAYPKRPVNKVWCPKVKAIRNFDLTRMMGFWYVVQYYASSEEVAEYACMRSEFSTSNNEYHHVTMNSTYIFVDDPYSELQQGNITWFIPDLGEPAHWMHTEDFYDGIYNTYVIDTDYEAWGLIMHCAEKINSPRYLSALLLSRQPLLENNVINFLREKLPKYDIDTSFMFPIDQTKCNETNSEKTSVLERLKYVIQK